MRTSYDHVSDDEISGIINDYDVHHLNVFGYDEIDDESHGLRIAFLAVTMDYWKTWIGLPVTFFKDDGSGYDGNHRVRAVKYLARQRNLQLQIPVRYVPKSMRFE